MLKKINVGVTGLHFGHEIIKEHLIAGAAAPYFRLAGVCDRIRTRADALAAQYGVKAHYDMASLLADPDIQAVCLMTDPFGRAQIIEQIIDAGKHVMTTKPFEVDGDAAIAALRHARERGIVVHLNSPTPRWSPDLARIKAWESACQLGRPIAARAEVWVKYNETADGTWYDDPAQCPVAPIFRLGIYLINDLVALLGQPESVSVMHSRILTGRPTPDNAQLSIRFKNGALANIFASFAIDDGQRWLYPMTVNYENGTVYRNVRPGNFEARRDNPEISLVVRRDGKPVSKTVVADGGTEDYQWEAFYKAINGEPSENEATPEEMVAGIRVIEAMVRAEKSGRVEKVMEDMVQNGGCEATGCSKPTFPSPAAEEAGHPKNTRNPAGESQKRPLGLSFDGGLTSTPNPTYARRSHLPGMKSSRPST